MGTVEERVAALETKLGPAPTLESRLKDLEGKLSAPRPAPKDAWDKWSAVGSTLSALVIAAIGGVFTLTVSHQLDRLRVNVDYAKEMRAVLTVWTSATSASDADAYALALSSFGEYAIPPLVSRLQHADDSQKAAEKGLRVIAITDHDVVCTRLGQIIAAPTRLYSWIAHRSLILLIGEFGCAAQRSTLEQYGRRLEASTPEASVAALAERVDTTEIAITAADVDEVRAAVHSSLAVLCGADAYCQDTKHDSQKR